MEPVLYAPSTSTDPVSHVSDPNPYHHHHHHHHPLLSPTSASASTSSSSSAIPSFASTFPPLPPSSSSSPPPLPSSSSSSNSSAPQHPNSSAESLPPAPALPAHNGSSPPTPAFAASSSSSSSIAFRQLPASAAAATATTTASSSTQQPRSETSEASSSPLTKEELASEVVQLRKELKDVYSVVHTLPKLLVVVKDLQERANQLERVVFTMNANINVGNTNTQLQQLQLQAQVQLLQYLQQLTPQAQQQQQLLQQQLSQSQTNVTPSGLPSSLASPVGVSMAPFQNFPGSFVHGPGSIPPMSGLASPLFSPSVKQMPSMQHQKHGGQDSQEEPSSDRSRPELSSSAASLLLSNAASFQEGITEVYHNGTGNGGDGEKLTPLDPANPPNDLSNLIIEMKRILKMEPAIFDGKPSFVAERALKEFSPQIDAVQRKFGFLRRELDRFCSTKIRIWINNNKMRGQKGVQNQVGNSSQSQGSVADIEDAEMSADAESGTPLESKKDGDHEGGDVKRRKIDGEPAPPPANFRLESFLPQAQALSSQVQALSSQAQPVERTEGN